jgi:hypothetical protein
MHRYCIKNSVKIQTIIKFSLVFHDAIIFKIKYKIANDKLNEKLALEEKDKKETEEKLGKQIETLKKDQEKLKIR